MRWVFGIIGFGLLGWLVFSLFGTSEQAEMQLTSQVGPSHKGVSLSPRSFGDEDFAAFFPKARELGDTVTWIGEVMELGDQSAAPNVITEFGPANDLLPISVAVIPIERLKNEDKRDEARLSLIAFLEKQKPEYLGIGNEINFMYKDDSDAFAAFVTFFADMVTELKKISPDTKIFTVWQLEWLQGLHGGLFGGINDSEQLSQWFLLEQFPTADLFAFTTYPMLIWKTPEEVPAEHYQVIQDYTEIPIGFTEVGWFRDGPPDWGSSVEEQGSFIERFFELTKDLNPHFRVWPFLYDQPIEWPFTTVGLLTTDQENSPAFDAWRVGR